LLGWKSPKVLKAHIRGIGVKLGEFGDSKCDIGSCEDREVIERAHEAAGRIILVRRFELGAFFEGSRRRFGVRHVVFGK